MDHKDVLRLDRNYVLKEFDGMTPTHIPDDYGYAKRWVAVRNMEAVITERDGHGFEAGLYGPWWPVADLDFRKEVGYETGSGNRLAMLVHAKYIDREGIPLMTQYETFNACGDCKGSSGGCPGFAPWFEDVKRRCDKVFVIVVHTDFVWAHHYAFSGSHKVMNQLSYMDRLTDNYINRVKANVARTSDSYALGAGNCTGCTPKRCLVIKGLPCKNPARRTFSLEAVGVDCDELHYQLYMEFLPWYYRNTHKMPTYMSRYAMVFCKESVDYVEILADVILSDKSYTTGVVPEPDKLYKTLMKVPGVHRGYKQYVYHD